MEEEKKEKTQIVVVLVGPPGSGKSTFCERVTIKSSSRAWSRVCQDTINNGKAGTKAQCVKAASTALTEGKSVFIDRCNLDKEQRSEFVKLGHSFQIEVHGVVLDLPAQLCVSRSVKRTGHEGNLQGGKAAAVVNRMLQNKEFPQLSQGFSRIVFCQNQSDVDAAIHVYARLGPFDSLPHGCFGERKDKSDGKVQVGIMRFFKKPEPSSNVGSDLDNHVSLASATVSKEGKDREGFDVPSAGDGACAPTLAFPSISTADFQFNIEFASDIIVEKVEEFSSKLGNAKFVLVDLSHGSKILSLVKAKAAQRNIDPQKFTTFVGDITQLYSGGGLRCDVIANTANWRLKPGGGGVNAAIFNAAGPGLEVATKERAKSILPGKAMVVPLPSDSPLCIKERVTHVIHVLGPNMNPQRPNCLNNDYGKGRQILREAYASLFDAFLSIVRSQAPKVLDMKSTPLNSSRIQSFGGENKVKRGGDCTSESSKKCKGQQVEYGAEVANHSSTSGNWGSWGQALYRIAMNPEKHKDQLLEISNDVVVLNDIYPKAKKHLLVLARLEGLDRLADVCKEQLPLLTTMHAMGLQWAGKLSREDSSLIFRLGYHSVPSMRQLHLHVISQDFDSDHLKNKKHWNSFNTPFFRDSVDVMEEVKNDGKATIKDSDLSMELRCHRCRSAHPNIPKLKLHIAKCGAPFPSFLHENGRLVVATNTDGGSTSNIGW